jgi:hypothetical protein
MMPSRSEMKFEVLKTIQDNSPMNKNMNEQKELLAYLMSQDFTQSIDLIGLLKTKYDISDDENEFDIKDVDLLKLFKITLYQVAMFNMSIK